MSQAIIDFCANLQTMLLSMEDHIAKARTCISRNSSDAQSEAHDHLETAALQLDTFKKQTALLADSLDELQRHASEAQRAAEQARQGLAASPPISNPKQS